MWKLGPCVDCGSIDVPVNEKHLCQLCNMNAIAENGVTTKSNQVDAIKELSKMAFDNSRHLDRIAYDVKRLQREIDDTSEGAYKAVQALLLVIGIAAAAFGLAGVMRVLHHFGLM